MHKPAEPPRQARYSSSFWFSSSFSSSSFHHFQSIICHHQHRSLRRCRFLKLLLIFSRKPWASTKPVQLFPLPSSPFVDIIFIHPSRLSHILIYYKKLTQKMWSLLSRNILQASCPYKIHPIQCWLRLGYFYTVPVPIWKNVIEVII